MMKKDLMMSIETNRLKTGLIWEYHRLYSDKYQDWVLDIWHPHDVLKKSSFPTLKDDFIMTSGLMGETGEVIDCYKKFIRGNLKEETPEYKELQDELKLEIGDVIYYLNMIATRFNIRMREVIPVNIEKLEKRFKLV